MEVTERDLAAEKQELTVDQRLDRIETRRVGDGLLVGRGADWIESASARPDYTVETLPGDCRFFEADDGVQFAIITRDGYAEAHCHGPWEHFREDGGCWHMDAMIGAQKPGRDFRVVPFGGRTCGCTREGWTTDENGPGYRIIHEEGCPNG